MMLSLSAKFEDLPLFNWFKYNGARKRTVVGPRGELVLETGKIFGVREMRTGNVMLLDPDAYHKKYVVDTKELNQILAKSDKAKAPKLDNIREGSGRAPRVNKAETVSDNRKWDAPYFKPARELNADEARKGVSFANYQWRVVTEPLKFKKSAAVTFIFQRKHVIGVRFIRPSIGGIVIDREGRRFSVTEKQWDEMLTATSVMPKNKWPEGGFTAKQMKEVIASDKQVQKDQKRNELLALREIEKAAKERDAAAAAEKRKQRKEELERIGRAAVTKPTTVEQIEQAKKASVKVLSEEEVRQELAKKQMEEEAQLLKEYGELDTISDDELDLDLPEAKQAEAETLEEDTEETLTEQAKDPVEMLDEVIADKRQKFASTNLRDLPEEPEEEDEEEDSEEEPDEEDDSDLDYEEEPEEETEDTDTEEEEEEYDEDQEDADLEDDEDVLAAEEEEADLEDESEEEESDEKTEAKKIEEGDVVQFKDDKTEKRSFAVLAIYPLPQNNSITVYKVYDITNEPEGYNTVRISSKTKRKFEDLVTLERTLSESEFAELDELVEGYPKINDAILS